jgi:predicted  nucleic acid-binding Zn-ribbon protein
VQVGNLVFSWISLLAAGVGVLIGASIASVVWARRARQTRQDFSYSMRKRAAQSEKLRDQFGELQEKLRHFDEQTIELTNARRDLAALRVELEHARATLEDTQRALEAARADVSDTESRLNAQLESERMDSAERRHHVESELGSARDAMLTLQDEINSARSNAQRTIERLETDLDATRAMLNQSADALRSEREAAAALRNELRTQLAAVDWDRQRAELELQEVRREMAEKLAATQPFVATMREQYLLAASERDAMLKELTMQRERAEANARAVEQARTEFAMALDEEHRTAMELLNRAWSYVQTFPRIPESWTTADRRPPATPHEEPPPPPPRRATEAETRIEVEPQADRAPHHPAAAPPQFDAPSDYDIEAELADAIADDLDTRSFTRSRKARKPIGTVKLGNETVVVCDDGSTWRRTERGWRQATPLPGTPVQGREQRVERAG